MGRENQDFTPPPVPRFRGLRYGAGGASYDNKAGVRESVQFNHFLIKEAADRGCDFRDLAKHKYLEPMELVGDWIQQCSSSSIERMLERALNYLFDQGEIPALKEPAR